MRLLVVEDEDLLRARLVKALEDQSFVVDSSSNGKTALFQAGEYGYDAAIIDLGLPEGAPVTVDSAHQASVLIRKRLPQPQQGFLLPPRNRAPLRVGSHGTDSFRPAPRSRGRPGRFPGTPSP